MGRIRAVGGLKAYLFGVSNTLCFVLLFYLVGHLTRPVPGKAASAIEKVDTQISIPVSTPRPRMDIMYALSSRVIIVLDAENELDHAVGSILETAYKVIDLKVFYEEPPPAHTLTARFRNEGFSRTQWSNFYSDMYSDAEFIGMVDSDTEFSLRAVPSKHFLLDWKKPVIHGIYIESLYFDCVKFMIGKDAVGDFMYVFPFIVKRGHFAMMRQHIIRHTGHQTFEQAWFDMQNRFELWGQFIVMANYLYHFHHDEYAWQIVYGKASTVTRPYPIIAKHMPLDQDVGLTARKYHNQMCVQSRVVAAECNGMTAEDIDMAKFVSFTDHWPISNGVKGYNMQGAKTHDGAAPRMHGDVFDEVMEEVFREGRVGFWNTSYNWTDRTKRPA